MVAKNNVTALAALPPGAKFRLHAKYRDGSPRPRYRVGKKYLAGETLTVVEQRDGVTVCVAGRTTVPLWSGWKVMA